MYRGVLIDKENRTNYTNYESADHRTDGHRHRDPAPRRRTSPKLRSKSTPPERGWKTCSSTGFTNVGLPMYFTDASTTVRNMTVKDAGDAGAGAGAHLWRGGTLIVLRPDLLGLL
ncbi:MAG: hypothetical protein CM15mP128_2970 [Methanobacteriota archaeon]|nr:MAG: hypothetical protein CM15mP128_2970 [Euryarchaeota archaeon]